MAYDSAKYGAVDGGWFDSPDAVVDDKNNGASHYLVDVSIEGSLTLEGSDEPVTFIPGMTATVDVLSGKRFFWNIYGNQCTCTRTCD